MDFLAQYSDGSDDDSKGAHGATGSNVSIPPAMTTLVNAAPAVDTIALRREQYVDPAAKVVFTNPKFDTLWTQAIGPAHPFHKEGVNKGLANHLTGHVETMNLGHFQFDDQYHTFHNYGYAANPAQSGVVGDVMSAHLFNGASVFGSKAKPNEIVASKKRKPQGRAGEEGYLGPWAPYEGEDEIKEAAQLTEEQIAYIDEQAKKKQKSEKRAAVQPTSVFHGKEQPAGQARPVLQPPSGIKPPKEDEHVCYIPKRWVHTWEGHTKGVQAIRFFPKFGHLLLSASMDSTVKLWDVYNNRKCLRTFMGHSEAVRDVWFNNEGTQFLSASYDRNIVLWDTETGQSVSTFSNKKVPYCVRVHPDADKQNIFLVGSSNKKVVQFDTRTGDVVQEYDEHLGAVNSVTFVEDGKKFISTSDDKKMFVWEFGIPVVIKHIAEPSMHSIPSVAVHPGGKYLAGQSLDNQIVVYEAQGRFRQNRRKRFTGHINSGYACQVNFSPDGQFVMSGDAEGKLWFWDWKSCKNFRTLKAHDGVCIGVEWHPVDSSKVATCGWDGLIKYWD
eukprot:GILJ01006815.1.p1 GENE.GILJ01006815.1~~GILJ01006815.1.p1  ORF type:complete len:573 (+),score=89.69 GILJ01006815.1:55-1719(+)